MLRPTLVDEEDELRVLVGCTLPPRVAGVPRGAVLLSVPHVLHSAAADAVAERVTGAHPPPPRLPRVPLVRVRWWGEDRPGSTLFRPTRISNEREDTTSAGETKRSDGEEEEEDEDEDRGDSSIRMRYPVCVPLEQLIGYLRDMKELVFDVVDRASRKKIGVAVLPFQLDALDSAEHAVQQLRRVNALCEIHSTSDTTVVLGYLTVNFEIEWTPLSHVSTPLKWASSSAAIPAISVNKNQSIGVIEREQERIVQQRLSFSSSSSSSTAEGGPPFHAGRQEVGAYPTQHARTEHSGQESITEEAFQADRINGIVEKGRALERSMTNAVTDDSIMVMSPNPEPNSSDSISTTHSMAMFMAPYEAMTEDFDNSWERVLEDANKIQPGILNNDRIDPGVSARPTISNDVSLGAYNALEISFESMELKQEMMEKLRQLREGSVSTRFSPVQLVVSHEHPKCILRPEDTSKADHWIAAFAVNSSLRKRHWRTNYAHTLPLLDPGSDRIGTHPSRIQISERALRFRVRCRPQHASPVGSRKRRVAQFIDLDAEVNVEELLDHREREWVLSLPLRMVRDNGSLTTDRPTAKRSTVVGNITVKFQFCVSSELVEEPKESLSDDIQESVWSRDESQHAESDVYPHAARFSKPSKRTDHLHHILANRGRPSSSEVGVPLFFGLLIDRALVRPSSDPKSTVHDASTSQLSLRIEYGTPTFFGKSAKSLRLKRSAKARLRHVESDQLRANVRHMNAFPLDLSAELVEKLERGVLILELWVQEQSTSLPSFFNEKLAGVVKIPLHAFVPCIRGTDAITECLSHPTPFVGVDQDFPIVDPFDDQVNGQVQVRMAFGSAEQMFNLKSALSAVVKLQSHARGWLVRKALGCWRRFELVGLDNESEELYGSNPGSSRMAEVAEHDNEASKSTAEGQDESSASCLPNSLVPRTLNQANLRITRADVRIEVREKYVSFPEHPLIGCEVYGQLRFSDECVEPHSAHPVGPRFTLWWDANDQQLNSHFVHALQSSSPTTGILLRDVILLCRVEPQPATGTKRLEVSRNVNTIGVAAIDLASVLTDAWDSLERSQSSSSFSQFSEDVDLPIEWKSVGNDDQLTLARILPLRVDMRITHEVSDGVHPRESSELQEENDLHMKEVTSVQTLSRTERLLPAALHLCLDLQRIADVRDMVQQQLALANRYDDKQLLLAFTGALERGTVTMTFVLALCLGVELHPKEAALDDSDSHFQDDCCRWYKRFRFEGIELGIVNTVQVLPSATQCDAYVLVHPELVSFLQEENLDIEIAVREESGEVTAAGTVSIPLSAILFRPSGVQGSFPVRVGDGFAGRIGIHMYIDQDDDRGSSVPASSSQAQHQARQQAEPQSQTSHVPESISHSIDPTQVNAVPTSSSQSTEEQTLERAVASIHEAAQQIQHRLARLTTRSNPPETDDKDSDRSSIGLTIPAKLESVASTVESPPSWTVEASCSDSRPSPSEAEISCDEGVDEHTVDMSSGCEGSEYEDQYVRAIDQVDSDQDNLVGSESTIEQFKPITLASLGIDEIDLSPIIDVSSPMFFNETETADLAHDDAQSDEMTSGGEEDDSSDAAHRQGGRQTPSKSTCDAHDKNVTHSEIAASVQPSSPHKQDDSSSIDEGDEEDCQRDDLRSIADDSDSHADGSMVAEDSVTRSSSTLEHELVSKTSTFVDDPAKKFEAFHSGCTPRAGDHIARSAGAFEITFIEEAEATTSEREAVCIDQSEEVNTATLKAEAAQIVESEGMNLEQEGVEIDQSGGVKAASLEPETPQIVPVASNTSFQIASANIDQPEEVEEAPVHNIDEVSMMYAGLSDVSVQGNQGKTSSCHSPAYEDFQASDGNDALQVGKAPKDMQDESSNRVFVRAQKTSSSGSDDCARPLVVEVLRLSSVDSSTQTDDVDDREQHSSCATSTQTQGIDDVALGEPTQNVQPETHNTHEYKSGAMADNGCQTSPEKILIATHDGSSDTHTRQTEIEWKPEPQTVPDQSAAGHSSTAGHSYPNSDIVGDTESPGRIRDIHHSLPAEKFRIAWQLLNEIRALYVDPMTAEPRASASETAESTVLTSRDHHANDPSLAIPPESRIGTTSSDAGDTILDTSEQKKLVDEADKKFRSFSRPSWQWRDASSLRAEVEERLQASKREYEEAMALSQSINSTRSWSESAQISKKNEWTADLEEKAQELSASALAKRRGSARTRTLFGADTETERIARIMQGSMSYWLHEDDDDGSLKSETSGDGADFVDNCF